MKMTKNRIKTGLPQRSLSTNAPPLVLFSGEWGGPRLFAAKLLDFESSVNVKFLRY